MTETLFLIFLITISTLSSLHTRKVYLRTTMDNVLAHYPARMILQGQRSLFIFAQTLNSQRISL